VKKLYVIVRADLPPGAQLAQSCHVVSAFAVAHPELHRAWHTDGQNLVCLQVPDRRALEVLDNEISPQARAAFVEPDFGGELTALAMSDDAARYLSSLPLALRTPRDRAA
jgi:peptidyl-tRNA hydrolase